VSRILFVVQIDGIGYYGGCITYNAFLLSIVSFSSGFAGESWAYVV
jgi:hypothetical protein